jgi:hypothetical protein
MKLTEGGGGGNYEQPPVGTAIARCYRIIDLGTQEGEFQGKKTWKRQVVFTWELPTELMTEGDHAGQPFSTSKFYTASLNEKANLRKDLTNWRGKEFSPEELSGFDPKNVLGKACMLSITMSDKGKARITGVSGLPKGIQVPPQVNPSVYFTLDDFHRGDYESLPKFYKELIAKSPEYQKIVGSAGDLQSDNTSDLEDENLPF